MSIIIILINNRPKRDIYVTLTKATEAAFYFVGLALVC